MRTTKTLFASAAVLGAALSLSACGDTAAPVEDTTVTDLNAMDTGTMTDNSMMMGDNMMANDMMSTDNTMMTTDGLADNTMMMNTTNAM